MGNYRVKRRGDSQVQDNGIWAGTIGFQCPWAHPVWSEYLLLAYDITTPAPVGHETIKRNPSATHEFILCALDPATPLDFGKSMFEQRTVTPLTPPNHGYQFVAESNDAAWARVNELVDACYREVTPGVFALNPDTDFRRQWDRIMADGWTLRESVLGSSLH